MRHLNLEKFRATRLETAPFTYLIVPGFLKSDSLRAVNATFPTIGKGGSFPLESVDARAIIKDVINELDGPEFEAAVSDKFGVALSDKPKMYSLRGYVRNKDGQIHTDSRDKIITVLLYLNEKWPHPEARLRLLFNGNDLDNYAAEIAPEEGNLLVFRGLYQAHRTIPPGSLPTEHEPCQMLA